MSACPVCGFTNRVGVLICEKCGSDLYDSLLERVATKRLNSGDLIDTRDLDVNRPPSSNPIVIYVSHERSPLAINRQGELIIGRYDTAQPEIAVDVDLTPYGAQDEGVSRQHLRLNAAAHPPIVLDMGSYNGTYVNGQKLIPNQPHVLNSGDELRLGRLVLRMYYK